MKSFSHTLHELFHMSFHMQMLPLLLAGALVGFAVSCEEKPEEPIQEEQKAPQSLLDLNAAFQSSKTYVETRQLNSFSKIFFTDGSSVVVPSSEWTLEDRTGSENAPHRSVEFSGTTWKVDGKDTGMARTEGGIEKSVVVYAFFDMKYLYVYASNGDVISFDNGWAPEDPNQGENPGGNEQPDDPDTPPQNPTEDPLHNKDIPASFQIPKVYIFTDGGAAIDSKTDYRDASFRLEDPSKFFGENAKIEVRGKIRGRGNTTWGMPKKPYRIKFDEKIQPFGGVKAKNWILLANYSDKSLLRNITMMEVSRICGMKWTPRMLSVEVYLNNQYEGVYTFCDNKEVGKGRVEIDVVTESDIDGGYYLEIEEAMDEPVCFKSVMDTPFMFHEPEVPTDAQFQYVKDYVNAFESALMQIQGGDRETYRQYLDIPSFINYYIIQEVAKNPDGNVRKSTYLTKEKDSPLEMYHVWDFDITLGNCDYTNFEKPEGWQMRYVKWYNQLFFDPEYKAETVKRWKEVYPRLKEEVPEFIERQYRLMEGKEADNFKRWDILGKKVWPNYYYFPTYQEEYDFLLSFYLDRLEWLNSEICSDSF